MLIGETKMSQNLVGTGESCVSETLSKILIILVSTFKLKSSQVKPFMSILSHPSDPQTQNFFSPPKRLSREEKFKFHIS